MIVTTGTSYFRDKLRAEERRVMRDRLLGHGFTELDIDRMIAQWSSVWSDYVQSELRVMAHLIGEERMIDIRDNVETAPIYVRSPVCLAVLQALRGEGL